jgi:hypothetical protein
MYTSQKPNAAVSLISAVTLAAAFFAMFSLASGRATEATPAHAGNAVAMHAKATGECVKIGNRSTLNATSIYRCPGVEVVANRSDAVVVVADNAR